MNNRLQHHILSNDVNSQTVEMILMCQWCVGKVSSRFEFFRKIFVHRLVPTEKMIVSDEIRSDLSVPRWNIQTLRLKNVPTGKAKNQHVIYLLETEFFCFVPIFTASFLWNQNSSKRICIYLIIDSDILSNLSSYLVATTLLHFARSFICIRPKREKRLATIYMKKKQLFLNKNAIGYVFRIPMYICCRWV
jgi:hypothetical protein